MGLWKLLLCNPSPPKNSQIHLLVHGKQAQGHRLSTPLQGSRKQTPLKVEGKDRQEDKYETDKEASPRFQFA